MWYFIFPFAIIIDVKTNSHCTDKRKVYHILPMKSCVLPGIVVSLMLYYLFLVLYLYLIFRVYDHCYPKDNNINNEISASKKKTVIIWGLF